MSALPETQKVVLINEHSENYDVLKYQDFPTPKIESSKDVIIKNHYAGVNFIEGYFRKGVYPVPGFPYVLGREASGEVVAVGSAVKDYKVGDKVVYLQSATFAEYTKIPEDHPQIAKIPADTSAKDFELYGSFSVQALTAYSFIEKGPYRPQKGDYVLVWAAAGGVGQIFTQILSKIGVNVIALASTDDKLKFTKTLGAKYTINYKTEDVINKVLEFTDGKGAQAAYDGIGKATWNTSLGSLGVGGVLVSYGNASGLVPPIDLGTLSAKNHVVARPVVFGYLQDKKTFNYFFDKVVSDHKSGKVTYKQPVVHDLKDYPKVAKELESGTTSWKFVLKI
ncbi:NADPH:quinone reductase [Yamadazyma tenuis]|uniref:NAD(P)-binding protein n=1 Tax=Candida tenuis (strain ATCC 10573 / BCRC 21748 / CBS 615 / JCM 9827 / NBRC 10315 / NRRL Y-1498 / VKM Y-70) TaxID=590646 RepID=G3BAX1_CANTC|nr:NAD(P)-binding protein [Yamadazyma tenuis ATCC 10573]XP_006688703.1 uncharacterized protein CANTEDRAFT_114937 [Yamadazyma tenuis ATCC 10573]EGV62532.1 NAD(P)-binding protein [Yamadazyma tenuis ATCC 10573]EGV62533.1 hypothetical protein CANTEDRAFT_114937 [Yamadazyma tenuis ATCC 10573]WEJ92687.1 NADPH:quinone reductase [Yamadazyma tenuis]